jgi:ADP-ribose pyrophosphatase
MSSPTPLHENPWFRVFLRDGFYTFEPRHIQVCILPSIGGDLLMVRVPRPVAGADLLEFPAGGVDPGESPVQAARRELGEETGIWVEDLARFRPLAPLALAPDRMPAWPTLFQIELSEAEYAARLPFDEEILDLHRFTREQAIAAVSTGELRACLPMAMLFRLFCQSTLPIGARP